MTTQAQARDEINGLLKGAVDAYNAANSVAVQVLAEDVQIKQSDRPDAVSAHFRGPYIKHGTPPDGPTLGGVGGRRFTRAGILIVQVMTPTGDGFTLGDALATVARNAYEGVSTPNGVWFRKVTTKEVGVSGGYYQVNVTGTFEYTETK